MVVKKKAKKVARPAEDDGDEGDFGTLSSARGALEALRKRAAEDQLEDDGDGDATLPAEFWNEDGEDDSSDDDEDDGGDDDGGDGEEEDEDDGDDSEVEDEDVGGASGDEGQEGVKKGEEKGPYERFMERLKEEKEQEKKKPAAKAAAAAAAPKKSEFGEALRHAGLRKTPETALQEAEAKPSTLWYDIPLTLEKASLNAIASANPDMAQLKQLYREGEDALFELTQKHKQVEPWIFDKVAKAGTSHDKIAALALQLSRPDIETRLHLLEQLLAMAAKKNKKQQKEAGDALVALWISHVLPKKRKLKEFTSQPFECLPKDAEKRTQVLMYWYFEDRIKNLFKHFVTKVMSAGLTDPTMYLKGFWLNKCYALLNQVPELENMLLSLLCDKLGDVSRGLAARTVHHLQCFIGDHPQVREAVAQELERFLLRAHNRVQARQYATLVLNSIARKQPPPTLAKRLLSVYLLLLRQLVAEANVEHSMMHTLLTGMARVVPFLPEKEDLTDYYNALFTVAACGAYPHRISALNFLFQLVERFDTNLQKRFYQSLYLLVRAVPHSMPHNDRLAMFFALLYKALVFQNNLECQVSFVHRLLQMCQHQRPTYICCVLLLLSELCISVPRLRELIARRQCSEAEDPDEPYDPAQRMPFYAHAANEAFWLLERLTHHYHPVVVKFSMQLSASLSVQYAGNPLLDFSTLRFLDHFVYRIPKLKERTLRGQQRPRATLPYNSKEFRDLHPDRVQMDELFFYKFVRQKHERELEAMKLQTRKLRENMLLQSKKEKQEDLAELMEEFDNDEHVDMYNRYSYDKLDEDEIGKGENYNMSDEDDEALSDWDEDMDAPRRDGAGKPNRAQRRAAAQRTADSFDVRSAVLKSSKRSADEYIADAEDFDRILEAGRKAMDNARKQKQKGRAGKRKRGDDDDDDF